MTRTRHRPVRHPASSNQLERLVRIGLRAAGVRSRFVETEVARHHVYDAAGRGELPPMVLLHGLADSAATSVPMLPHLRAHARRIVMVESAGHGLSGHPRGEYSATRHLASITAVLDKLLDEPAILVGNSLGGATALHYARERPHRVRALFLTSPAGAPCDAEARAAIRATFTLHTIDDAHAFLERVYVRRPPLAAVAARIVRARAASAAVRDILGTAEWQHASPEELAGLAMPLMLLWGSAERVLPRDALDYFRTHLPRHAAILEPKGFGHCPHLDDPRRLARVILAFARQLSTHETAIHLNARAS